ncbi:MAG: hypothetical protein KKA42_00930, partial [candidate division Zixibacteria bacterium]|nr:hypothetical protein [candidate division Zixibacteria bacterium]
IGAGQLDFRSGFVGNDGFTRDDKTALILGAGVRAELVKGVLLNAGVRDYMYGQERLDRISGTTDISHNWLVSGALVFGIGGRGGAKKEAPAMPRSLPRDIATAPQTTDTAGHAAPQQGAGAQDIAAASAASSATGYVSEKNVVIPVPLEGEIYIRYGTPSRDVGNREIERVVQTTTPRIDSQVVDSAKQVAPVVDTAAAVRSQVPVVAEQATLSPTDAATPVSRNELDSLLGALRSDISSMLAARPMSPAVAQSIVDSSMPVRADDSLLAALREELARTQRERTHLDSLLQMQSVAGVVDRDSLAEQRIQQRITEQVAAALAEKPETASGQITQADLNAMMAALSGRIDSLNTQKSTVDSDRLRDQLQLEIIRQTKSQEEFQRALNDFTQRYQMQQATAPPAIIVTQPTAPVQRIERDEPTTVVIKPDTQFVVIRDSTFGLPDSLGVVDFNVTPQPRERHFIDLRPAGYMGFGLERPKQFVLGGRLDIGPITTKEERLRLVPEFALGMGGGGVSVMAVLNAEYGITEVELGAYHIIPYVRMGFGVLGFGGSIEGRDTEGVLNFTYGFNLNTRRTGMLSSLGDPDIFIEHQIIDLFDLNRIVLGLQWSP